MAGTSIPSLLWKVAAARPSILGSDREISAR